MSTPDLTRMIVLAPKGSGRMHLHLPGYRPGKKPRTQGNAPLCGVFVYPDLEQASLEQGRLWTRVRATWAGSGDAGSRYWCPPCLGRLVELFALQDMLIGHAASTIALARANAPKPDLTPLVDMGTVPGVSPTTRDTGNDGRDAET